MPSRKEIKARAKRAIRNRKPSTAVVTLVYAVICAILGYLSARLSMPSDRYMALLKEGVSLDFTNTAAMEDFLNRANNMLSTGANVAYTGPLASILSIAISVVTMLMGVGLLFYCIRVSRGANAGIGDLFDGFGSFGKVFLVNLLRGLIIFAWSIPAYIVMVLAVAFVISGALIEELEMLLLVGLVLLAVAIVLMFLPVVAEYRYRMAMYFVFDEPDMGISDTLRSSKMLMKGKKWRLFVQDLSFIGWYILCIVPFVFVYVVPYVGVAEAEFYNSLRGFGRNEVESTVEPEII